MHHVLISIASNYLQESHLSKAHEALAQVLHHPIYTKQIWTEPLGTGNRPDVLYLNQLVSAETTLDASQLTKELKQIERALGRTAELRSQGLVPIDLDLLQHDDQRFHLRDWERPYVKQLL